jgi:hypothetical protein
MSRVICGLVLLHSVRQRLFAGADELAQPEGASPAWPFSSTRRTPGTAKTRIADPFIRGIRHASPTGVLFYVALADGVVDRPASRGARAEALKTTAEPDQVRRGSAGIEDIRVTGEAAVASLSRRTEVPADLPTGAFSLEVFTRK